MVLLSDQAMAQAGVDQHPPRYLLNETASSAPIVVAIFSVLLGFARLLTTFGGRMHLHYVCSAIASYFEFFAYSLLASYFLVLFGTTASFCWMHIKRRYVAEIFDIAAWLLSNITAIFVSLFVLAKLLTKFSGIIFVHSVGIPTTMAGFVEVYALSLLISYAAVLFATGAIGWLHMRLRR